ncbi:MAG TPA: GFA family protein [Gammaproteobacteria bacterium]|nr:GFA family protein [Gammaproteobacteria bacterium]
MTAARRGQCLCGAVTLTAAEVETEFSACHCRTCQRWSGGIFLTTTARGVNFEGEENIRTFRASEWAERGFCKKCGTLLFYRLLKSNDHEICIGVFDDQSDLRLASEIFMDQKPGGYALAGDHPRLTDAETLEKYKVFA